MKFGKRLVIYFFYDKDGIADNYVDYFLNGLAEVTDKFVVVVNGKITPESRKMFLKYTDDIIVRKNEGLDVWAYKTALEYVGWEELRKYYEVCLVNATIMGPVYPFEEMFSKMDENQDLDFWGVTRCLKFEFDPFKCNPYGYIPEHIQSHFIVYRNRFLITKELKRFWDNMPKIDSYDESIGKYESYFTKYFEDSGFKWDTYVNNKVECQYTDYQLMVSPLTAIKIDRCPIIKRRSFFQNQDYFLSYTMGEQSVELFNYLKKYTNYNTNLILENLIRSINQSDLVRTLGLYYILPTSYTNEKEINCRAAVIMHIYYLDIIEESLKYALNIPKEVDIYITTPHKDKIETIKKTFKNIKNKVVFKVIENRGRDVSSLLVGCADIISLYDYICFYHDKKVSYVKPLSMGRSFAYKTSESALHNALYIENILSLFKNNDKLGMLTNTPPHGAVYYDTYGSEWGANFKNTKKLANELELNVILEESKPPIAPLGTVFWFRTKAMKKLFDKNWKSEDFPEEPNGNDGTLLHAIERIYPYVVQDAGYYPAYVMPDTLAAIEIADFIHYIRSFNITLQRFGIYGNNYTKVNALNSILMNNMSLKIILKNKLKNFSKKYLPEWVYNKLVIIKRHLFN